MNCCFCKEPIIFAYWGNNPFPISKKGKCCNDCNEAVIFVRMGIIPLEIAKKNKTILKTLYDINLNAITYKKIVD